MMTYPQAASRALERVAGELSRIELECLEVQDADSAGTMIGLSPEDMKRRQMLDRVTQEIAAIGAFVGALARTGDVQAALASTCLTSMQAKLSGDPETIVDAGEPELF